MKITLLFFCSILLIRCSSKTFSCDDLNRKVNNQLEIFYGNLSDSVTLKNKLSDWNTLIKLLCSKIDTTSNIFFLQRTTQSKRDGLVHLVDKSKFFYFKRNGEKIIIRPAGNEFDSLKNFILILESDFFNKSKTLIEESKKYTVHEQTFFEILYLNNKNTNLSGYGTFGYFPNMNSTIR